MQLQCHRQTLKFAIVIVMVQENAFKRDAQITSVKLRGNKNDSSLRYNNDFLAADNNENR